MRNKHNFQPGQDFAKSLDRDDALKSFREQFHHPDSDLIYLDGNSLGRLPIKTAGLTKDLVERQWGDRLIRSWNEGWYDLSGKINGKLAKILGAKTGEIAVGDSTSVNLYKTAMAAMKLNKDRKKIVSDVLNFPSDIYVLQGIADQLGDDYKIELAQSEDGVSVSMEELNRVIDTDTALVVLSAVVFKSAFMYDMKAVTELVHRKGALMIWDLSHAAGAVPVDLNGCGADMAIGCTYKYLNGGPGSPAYLFVSDILQDKITSPIWGWFGESDPFAFELKYKPAVGIRRFMAGTPPILSLAAVEPGLDLILDAGMENLRRKSVLQSEYLVYLWEEYLKPLGYEMGSPSDTVQRGSHISLRHPEAYRICKALIEPKDGSPVIIPDFREPDNIRLGIAPLYNSFQDIYQAANRLKKIVELKQFEGYPFEKDAVT
jgi:kynureninase